jgi:hypothetical protein
MGIPSPLGNETNPPSDFPFDGDPPYEVSACNPSPVSAFEWNSNRVKLANLVLRGF